MMTRSQELYSCNFMKWSGLERVGCEHWLFLISNAMTVKQDEQRGWPWINMPLLEMQKDFRLIFRRPRPLLAFFFCSIILIKIK